MGGVIVVMTTGLGRIPELSPKSKVGNEEEGEVEGKIWQIYDALFNRAFSLMVEWSLATYSRPKSSTGISGNTSLADWNKGVGGFFPSFFFSLCETDCQRIVHVSSRSASRLASIRTQFPASLSEKASSRAVFRECVCG